MPTDKLIGAARVVLVVAIAEVAYYLIFSYLSRYGTAWDLATGLTSIGISTAAALRMVARRTTNPNLIFLFSWYTFLALSRFRLLQIQVGFGWSEYLGLVILPLAFSVGYRLAPERPANISRVHRFQYTSLLLWVSVLYVVLSVYIYQSRGALLVSENISAERFLYAMPFVSVIHAFLHYLLLCLLFVRRSRLTYVIVALLFANSLFVYFSRGDIVRLLLILAFAALFTERVSLQRILSGRVVLAGAVAILFVRLFAYLGDIRYRYDPQFSILDVSASTLTSTVFTWSLVYLTSAYDLAALNLQYGTPLSYPFALVEPLYYTLQMDRLWGDPTVNYQWVIVGSLNNVGGLAPFIRDLGVFFFLEFLLYGLLIGTLWKRAVALGYNGIMAVISAMTFLVFFDAGLLANFRLFAILAAFYLLGRTQFDTVYP